jgi:hypothetical protein
MAGANGASGSGSQGGQGYLASVSDLVSAFIFVFIIMLAIFAYQLATATQTQDTITEELMAAEETRNSILAAIANRLESSGIRVEILLDQGVLRLSENSINFSSGSEIPVVDHHLNVGRVAKAIAEVVPCYVFAEQAESDAGDSGGMADASAPYCELRADPSTYDCRERTFPWLLETLLIEGHTDDVPVAGGHRFRDNLELSSMRAATVHRMITACEPGVERFVNSDRYPILSTSGYGNTRPATRDPARSHENRRIDLRFLLEPPKGALTRGEPGIQVEFRERVGEREP